MATTPNHQPSSLNPFPHPTPAVLYLSLSHTSLGLTVQWQLSALEGKLREPGVHLTHWCLPTLALTPGTEEVPSGLALYPCEALGRGRGWSQDNKEP